MDNKALDAEPPIASFLRSMLIGGGPVIASVIQVQSSDVRNHQHIPSLDGPRSQEANAQHSFY
jgi:hypothetical protein